MSERGLFFDHDGQPIDVHAWEALRADPGVTTLARDRINDCDVVTVWVGIDHSFGATPAPMIYETTVFGGPLDSDVTHYPTATEARAGHAVMAERVLAAYDALSEADGAVLDVAMRRAADAALSQAAEVIAVSKRKRRHTRA